MNVVLVNPYSRKCVYQGVRNYSFSENFAYALNEWSLEVWVQLHCNFEHSLRKHEVFLQHFMFTIEPNNWQIRESSWCVFFPKRFDFGNFEDNCPRVLDIFSFSEKLLVKDFKDIFHILRVQISILGLHSTFEVTAFTFSIDR